MWSRARRTYFEQRWACVESELERHNLLTKAADDVLVAHTEARLAGHETGGIDDWLADAERRVELGELTLERNGWRVPYARGDDDGRFPWGIEPPPELLTEDGYVR